MTDIGELVVRIKADATQLQQEMAKAGAVVKESASSMEKAAGGLKDQFRELIPALSVGAFVEFGRRAVEAAGHLNDLALRTGIAASTLSALEPALQSSGSSVDDFAGSVNRMNNLIGEAAKGTNQEAVKAFDALGLSVRKLQQLSPEQQFYQIAQALGAIDDQSQMTNAGMAIFGRSFAAIIPLIKEANGNIENNVQQLKDTKEALSQETIERIDAFGDAMTRAAIRTKNRFLETLATILEVIDKATEAAAAANAADTAGRQGTPLSNSRVSSDRPITVNQATFENQNDFGDGPPSLFDTRVAVNNVSAKGNNVGLLTPPKDSALKEYIANLKQETDAVAQNERALFIARAEIEASAKAKADFNDKLRTSKTLLPDEKNNIDQLAGSFYDLKKAQEENARVAKMMKDALADSLADIAVNFDNLKDTATSAIQAIAKEIIKAKITQPFANSVVDALPSFNFSSLASSFGGFFADGGDPPVGMPSIVGENGPELFVPRQAGTIIPNSKMGGTTVVVQQTINMQPGVVETVGAAIRSSAPQIAAMAHASVMNAIQNGGTDSRIVGRRS